MIAIKTASRIALFAALGLAGVTVARAQTFNSTGGTLAWNVNANWSPATFPNGIGASATFQNPTAAQTVNLSAAITVGSISFTNNGTFVQTLANGTGGSLILDEAGSGPATIIYNGTNSATGNLAISASLTLNDTLSFTNNNVAGIASATAQFTGAMSGAGGFVKNGAGRTTMSTVAKTYTGATVINQGRLRFTATGAATGTSSITVNSGGSLYLDSNNGVFSFGSAGITINGDGDNGGGTGTQGALRNQNGGVSSLANSVALGSDATIHVDAAGTLQLNGGLSGSNTLTKSGSGTLALTTANASLTGGTSIQNGTISTTSASRIGNGALNFAQTTGNNTAVTLANSAQTVSSLSTTWIDTTGTQSQTVTLTGTALTIDQSTNTTFGNGAVGTLTGVITGNGSIIKTGSGTLTLTGNNTYSGGTTIGGGTILANSATSSLGSGAVTVASGGTLGGNGVVAAPVTVQSGGAISPGASAGLLTVNGDVTFQSGAKLVSELNGNFAGTSYDQLVVNGNVNLGSSNLLLSLGAAPATTDFYYLVLNTGAGATNGAFSGLVEGSVITASFAGTTYQGNIYYGANSVTDALFGGNDVLVTGFAPLAAVPEPGSLALLGLAALPGVALLRRRKLVK